MSTRIPMRDIPRITLPLTPSEAWKPPLGGDLLLRYYAYGLPPFLFLYLSAILFVIAHMWTLIDGLAVVIQSPLLYDSSALTRSTDLTRS